MKSGHDDRRFNVGKFQPNKLIITDAELAKIDKELQAFHDYLLYFQVNKDQVYTPLLNQERDELMAQRDRLQTLLDRMRAGTQAIDQAAVQLLLECLDQIELLLHELSDSSQSHLNQQRSRQLMLKLDALKDGDEAGNDSGTATNQPPGAGEAAPAAATEWLLGIRFGPDNLRDGYDPLAFVRYLGQLGELLAVQALTDQLPALEQLDAERCQLGLLLHLRSAASREQIVQAFDFVADSCQLRLLQAPFEPSALQSQMGEIEADPDRLQSMLRRASLPAFAPAPVADTLAHPSTINRPPGLSVEPVLPRAWLDGEAIDLTQREWALLRLLVQQQGQVVSREDVLAAWQAQPAEAGGSGLASNALEVYVHRLRRKLAGSALNIRNIRGLGYMLEDSTPG